ncbi:MAG: aminopeptidase, partial [Defluviitaleaceae bacterium]|nr:aminopeptidase [Defluviitaleaceae bacterium]
MTNLEKYAFLAVEKGVNLQKNQKLLIRSDVVNSDFVEMIAKISWEKGAKDVMVQWRNEKLSRLRFLNGEDDIFGIGLEWFSEYTNKLVKEDYQLISIDSSNPDNLNGVNIEKISKETLAISRIYKPFFNRAISNEIQWTI